MIFFELLLLLLFLFTVTDFYPKCRRITLCVSFLLCVCVAGFRNMGGVDYVYYENHYYGRDRTASYEIGYEVLVSLFRDLGFSYEQYIFILSFLTFWLLFCCIKRYSPMPQLTVLLYVGSFFLFYNIIAIRQSVALAIFIYSIRYVESNRWPQIIFLIFCAFLFHNSAVILLLGYLFIKYFRLNLYWILIGLSLALLFQSIDLFNIVNLFDGRMGLSFVYDKMQYYVDDDRTFTLFTIIKLSVLLLLIMFSSKKNDGPYFRIFANMTILYILLFVLFNKWGVLSRMWVYFEVGYIFILPIILKNCRYYIKMPIYFAFAGMAVYSLMNMIYTFDDGDMLKFNLNFL